MKTMYMKSHKFEYFDSIKEMNISRFAKFQKFLFQAWGVGNTMSDVDLRLTNSFQLVASKENEKAMTELHNMRLTINHIINDIDIKSYAFAVLINKINDELLFDLSESGLKEVILKFEQLFTVRELEIIIDEVKKNLNLN